MYQDMNLGMSTRYLFTVADPGFSWGGGGNPKNGCANLLFCKFFAENCMKMKELGPQGARVPGAPLDLPMVY